MISLLRSLRSRHKARPTPQSGYLRGFGGGSNAFLTMPGLRDAHEDIRLSWPRAAGLAIDALHNNGWIAGVVEALISLMIGEGLRPNLKPDFGFMGWDERQASEWARLAERRFSAFAANKYECDAGGRYSLGQLQAAGVRQWFATGEILLEVPTIKRPGNQWSTKLRLLPSHWLSQRSDSFKRLTQGVYLDAHGCPSGFLFELKDRFDAPIEVKKAARDHFGRPKIVHIFDGAAGQIRGITPFAPILKCLRNYDQLSSATLSAAMIHAVFAATIESDYPSSGVLEALQSTDEQDQAVDGAVGGFDGFLQRKVGWHEHTDINLGRHGKLAHLMLGERLKLNRAEQPNSTYEPFANFLLREIARCAGALFEDLTGDFRGATYSSIRMGIAKQWPLLLYRRRHIAAPLCQAALEAWLEEEIDSGGLPFPGGLETFLPNKAAVCRAGWYGPAKPVADEVKAAKAHELYRDMGVISDDQICNDLGVDRDDVYRLLAFELEERKRLGLDDPERQDKND